MGFYEDIAEALDAEGFESRIAGDTLFVPITSELDLQFVGMESSGPIEGLEAATVFLTQSAVSAGEEVLEAVLVGAVFSVDAAVKEVVKHVATDRIIEVLEELLEGEDDRLEDVNFEQDPVQPHVLYAPMGDYSMLMVSVQMEDETPCGLVQFITHGEGFEDLMDQAAREIVEGDEHARSIEQRRFIMDSLAADVGDTTREIMELGRFEDFDVMFDAIAAASQNALEWEELLVPIEDDDDDYGWVEDEDPQWEEES